MQQPLFLNDCSSIATIAANEIFNANTSFNSRSLSTEATNLTPQEPSNNKDTRSSYLNNSVETNAMSDIFNTSFSSISLSTEAINLTPHEHSNNNDARSSHLNNSVETNALCYERHL